MPAGPSSATSARTIIVACDRAVMAVANQMTLQNMRGEVTPALAAKLRRFFSAAKILYRAMVAAVLTGMAKMPFTCDLVSREATCPIGPRS
jgi:hypothetical protein